MALQAISLCCLRGNLPVFENLSFQLEEGQQLLLLGANGAGKTTLLRVLAGLIALQSGSILWRNQPITPGDILPRIHYCGHQNGIKRNLSLHENLSDWAGLYAVAGAEQKDRIGEALEIFQLSDCAHLPAGFLSAGRLRRLALARLALCQRPLWLLDEPEAGLDQNTSARFGAYCAAHLKQAGMIIRATHLGGNKDIDCEQQKTRIYSFPGI